MRELAGGLIHVGLDSAVNITRILRGEAAEETKRFPFSVSGRAHGKDTRLDDSNEWISGRLGACLKIVI